MKEKAELQHSRRMVLVLVIGDLHFKKDSPTTTDLVVHKITEQIMRIKPDLVVLLGDILDTHEKIDMKTLNKSIRFIKSIAAADIPVAVIIGNHDRPDGTTFLTEESAFYCLKNLPNIHVADRVLDLKLAIKDKKELIRFIMVPYVPAGSFHEALDTLDVKVMDKNQKTDAIFCHQEFKGVKIGGYVSKNGDDWPENNPLVISGHIHTMQQVQPNIIYTGTPYQQSFNDDSAKGILVCEFLPGMSPSINFLELDIRKKKSIKLRPAEVDSFVPPPNCDLQVDIVGTSDEIKALSSTGIIAKMRSRGVSVSLSTQRTTNPGNPENKPFRELLLSSVKDDVDALSVFHEIFTVNPTATVSIGPSTNLSDLLKSAQSVSVTKTVTDSTQLMNDLLARARTVGTSYGTPFNLAANPVSASPAVVPKQTVSTPVAPLSTDLQSLFANFNTAAVTEKAVPQPTTIPLTSMPPLTVTQPPPPAQLNLSDNASLAALFNTPQAATTPSTLRMPSASIELTPSYLINSKGVPLETKPSNSELISSMMSSVEAEKNKPKGGLLESLMPVPPK